MRSTHPLIRFGFAALLPLGLSACRDNSLPAWANPPSDAGSDDGSAVDADPTEGGAGDAASPFPAEGGASEGGGNGGEGVRLPVSGSSFDYQIGGAYPPPEGVDTVSRDRQAPPAEGLYNLCYVNGFQAQPDEEAFWLQEHPTLVLRDEDGQPVIDADWDEMLLDVGSDEKRASLAGVVGGWIDQCAADGYDAVEVDNLDSFTRSGGRLTETDAVAFMRMLSDRAHDAGLAVAQKNAAELVDQRSAMGTDFVVAEECNRWDECDVYTGAYGDDVLVIEYRRRDFDAGCAAFPELSIVLRDLDVSPAGEPGYVYEGC